MVGAIAFLVLLAAGLALLYAVPKLFAPRAKTKPKELRFEAGNPPYGRLRRRMVIQYIRYVLAAASFEALASLALVAYSTAQQDLVTPLALTAVVAGVMAAVGGDVWSHD
ncbi:MAG: NADH-quinone oxidoreductase [Thermoproteus sp. AZ2]|jgi:NADH-quinone oxidoreductase subunit A|uniref:NADH-quinone oxidoreductase n=1 Tax=Thermoproteus sp. AZ2 TaxID=1609232 RepID=A0ACC6V304_9CREN|nr:MAG: hypothetical protein TU35_05845 [Thermoproteus sp. AZ2]